MDGNPTTITTSSSSDQQALVPLDSNIVSDADIDICTSCEFVEGEASRQNAIRHCYDCLCFYCGLWTPPASSAPSPATDPEGARARLMTCRTCASRSVMFGQTRVHAVCHYEVLKAVPPSRSVNDVVCAACGTMLLRGRAALKPEVQEEAAVEGDEGAARRPVLMGQRVPPHATAVKREGDGGGDVLMQAPCAYAVPDLLHALMNTDPRTSTFEALHYGALCAAVRALQSVGAPRATTLPAAVSIEQLPTCPPAAARTVLSMSQLTGEWMFSIGSSSDAAALLSRRRRGDGHRIDDDASTVHGQRGDADAIDDNLSLMSRRQLAFIASQRSIDEIEQLANQPSSERRPGFLLDTTPLVDFLKRKKKAAISTAAKRGRSSSSSKPTTRVEEPQDAAGGVDEGALTTDDVAGAMRPQLRQALEHRGLLQRKVWHPRRQHKATGDAATAVPSTEDALGATTTTAGSGGATRRRVVWQSTGHVVAHCSIVTALQQAHQRRQQEALRK